MLLWLLLLEDVWFNKECCPWFKLPLVSSSSFCFFSSSLMRMFLASYRACLRAAKRASAWNIFVSLTIQIFTVSRFEILFLCYHYQSAPPHCWSSFHYEWVALIVAGGLWTIVIRWGARWYWYSGLAEETSRGNILHITIHYNWRHPALAQLLNTPIKYQISPEGRVQWKLRNWTLDCSFTCTSQYMIQFWY